MKKQTIRVILIGVLLILFCVFSFLFYFSVQWLEVAFSGITLREVIFHLQVPLKGTSKEMINSFIGKVIIPGFIIFFILLIVNLLGFKFPLVLYSERTGRQWQLGKIVSRFCKILCIPVSAVLILLSLDSLVINFKLDEYVKGYFQRTTIYAREYIDPANVRFTFPEKKRNLVFIIMESIESTFFREEDGGYYKEDLMPELRKLALKNVHFSNNGLLGGAAQVSGTGWTVAALVSHLLGIPLVLPIHGNAYEGYEQFLPGATGLTDILDSAGYQQRFLIGSDKKFAGRDVLFKTHGNILIKDLQYYKENGKIPNDYHVWWGFEDEKLYALAKEELQELSSRPYPFNLMLLTVDTHHVGGYVCNLCKNNFDSQYKNVIACASRQVSSFVSWIQSQPWYDNTTIVIIGDHLYMDGSFVPYNADRRTYNVYINSVAKTERVKYRQFSALDTFPTILDSLGVYYDGPGLALGRSLYRDTETLIEKYGIKYLSEEIVKKNQKYDALLHY